MKKIILMSLLCMPFMAFADTPQQCRNSNIVSYTPTTQTSYADQFVYFYVNPNIKISSLQASFNGKAQPVQYKTEGDFIRARVFIPDNLAGDIVTTIGAESVGGCNPPISFMFTR